MITKEEFEAGYAAKSGLTIDELHQAELIAEPCDCGDPICKGWCMPDSGLMSGKVKLDIFRTTEAAVTP